MEMSRENFMGMAGDLLYELNENDSSKVNDVEAPLVTNSTGFFTIYCC